MNSLMWFIYLANVLPGLAVLGGCLVALALLLGFMLPPYGSRMFMDDHHGPLMGFTRIEVWIVLAVGAFFALVTPDQETIYLMAGAKGAEMVVESEAGKEILGDIQEVIRFQLDDLKKTPLTNQSN